VRRGIRRHVNDQVRDLAIENGAHDAEFLCECNDFACVSLVRVPINSYDLSRAAERPILSHGHPPL
jgi:hypothetical protein